ncbi:MAG: sigma factor-like helix-turn-helix DNA-binding protein [Candidatus Hadarchaeum sp.]
MEIKELVDLLRAFRIIDRAFSIDEILELTDTSCTDETLRNYLRCNPHYVCLDGEDSNSKYFIYNASLYRWFARLSFRLAANKVTRVNSEMFARLVSASLVSTGRWDKFPAGCITFGQRYGFVGPAYDPNQYVFPLANVLSFLSPRALEIARRVLESLAEICDDTAHLESFLHKSLMEGFSNFNARVRKVIEARGGLTKGRKKTLEEIGKELHISRERVRQLESKFWDTLTGPKEQVLEPFIAALLCDVMVNHGSCVLKADSEQAPLRRFIFKCAGVPEVRVPGVNIIILGAQPTQFCLPKSIITFPNFISSQCLLDIVDAERKLCLINSDIVTITESITQFAMRRLTKTQKVYLALRAIGKPAHYSNICEVYNSMFPDDKISEYNIHALLSRQEHGVVWIGIRGTFALREWGYEPPEKTLCDSVTEIVRHNFEKTGKPVPFDVIRAEIGKYRQVVNPRSLTIATHCNPALRRVSKSLFVPTECSTVDSDEKTSLDDLDRILKEFELRKENK